MKDINNEKFRLRNKITGDIENTCYRIIMEEEDPEIPGLVYLYLLSEYEDENIEYEPRYNIYYAKITTNMEGLLV